MNTPSNKYKKRLISYLKKHYQWLILVLLTIIGIVVAYYGIIYEPATKQKYYLAYELRSTKNNEKVTCGQSQLSDRTDARSCYKENNKLASYDPCFLMKSRSYVDCPKTPEGSTSEQFEIILDGGGAGGYVGHPWFDVLEEKSWFLQLSNGHICKALVGTTNSGASLGVNYLCDDKNLQLILPINISKNKWTIRCSNGHDNVIKFCKIDTAWF